MMNTLRFIAIGLGLAAALHDAPAKELKLDELFPKDRLLEVNIALSEADWEKIRSKAEQLRKYGLEWWLKALLPALDQFVAAAHGRPDLDFWMSLCFINVGTSYPIYEPLNGWVQVFFPYLIAPGQGFRHADPYSGKHHALPRIQCPHLLHPP